MGHDDITQLVHTSKDFNVAFKVLALRLGGRMCLGSFEKNNSYLNHPEIFT